MYGKLPAQPAKFRRREPMRLLAACPVHWNRRRVAQISMQYRRNSAHHSIDRRVRPAGLESVLAKLLEDCLVRDRRDWLLSDFRLEPGQKLLIAPLRPL